MRLFEKLLGRRIESNSAERSSSSLTGKAASDDILARFREIVSDPLNLLIEPSAGRNGGRRASVAAQWQSRAC